MHIQADMQFQGLGSTKTTKRSSGICYKCYGLYTEDFFKWSLQADGLRH